MKYYLGIDVGKDGGLALYNSETGVLMTWLIPDDLKGLDECFSDIRREVGTADILVLIEDVHSIFGSSAKSNFQFGRIKGVKEALSVCWFGGYELVQPKKWQGVVWEEKDIVLKDNGRKDTKLTSANAAREWFPGYDFRKSQRARKPHDGLVDAALIALYGLLSE